MSHRFSQDVEPLRGEQGTFRPAHWDLLRDDQGQRPVYGACKSFSPILIGGITYSSSNTSAATMAQAWVQDQNGWSGLVSKFIHLVGILDAKQATEGGKMAGFKVDIEPKDADPAILGSLPKK